MATTNDTRDTRDLNDSAGETAADAARPGLTKSDGGPAADGEVRDSRDLLTGSDAGADSGGDSDSVNDSEAGPDSDIDSDFDADSDEDSDAETGTAAGARAAGGAGLGAGAVVSAALGVVSLSGGWLGTVAAARSSLKGQIATSQGGDPAAQIQAVYGDSWEVTALIGGAFALAALLVGAVVLARPAFGTPGPAPATWIRSVAWGGVTLGLIGLVLAVAKYTDLLLPLPSAP